MQGTGLLSQQHWPRCRTNPEAGEESVTDPGDGNPIYLGCSNLARTEHITVTHWRLRDLVVFFFFFLYRHTGKLYATPMYTLHKGNSFNQPLVKHGSFQDLCSWHRNVLYPTPPPPYKRHFRSNFLVGDISMHFYRIKEANRQKAQIKPY